MIGALDIAPPPGGAGPWRLTATGGSVRADWAVGRPAEDVARLMPRVFNLCGATHARASRQALGLPPDAAGSAGLARQERLRDHALALFADLPSLLGRAPDRAALRGLAGAGDEAAPMLRHHVLGRDIDLANATPGELARWLAAAPSPVAALLAHIRTSVDPAWGRAELPLPVPADIAAALEAGAPAAPRETTVADAWRAAPLLNELHASEGASLFLRTLVRLLDLIGCLAAEACDLPETLPAAGEGIGLARAARGLLAHRARVVAGIVTDYRVLSPSAWNLAPGGLLASMLAALPMNHRTPMLARLVISCVNPCVKVTLRLDAREDAHA